MEKANSLGYEGLVIRQGDVWYKVKPIKTEDIQITGILEGSGRLVGKVGSFMTAKGNVGSGLNDLQREDYKNLPVGTYIKVKYTRMTLYGNFWHPRFVEVLGDVRT